jgi:hypothetical protein
MRPQPNFEKIVGTARIMQTATTIPTVNPKEGDIKGTSRGFSPGPTSQTRLPTATILVAEGLLVPSKNLSRKRRAPNALKRLTGIPPVKFIFVSFHSMILKNVYLKV